MNDRIDNLLRIDRLVHEAAPDEEVVGLWESAVEAFEDARLVVRSPKRRLTAAYDAGRLSALALVRAAGLRVRARNHHEVTLTAAGFLGGDELDELLQEFQALRLERIQIEYGWSASTSPAQIDEILPGVREILGLIGQAIREQRPSVRDRISPPAGTDAENG